MNKKLISLMLSVMIAVCGCGTTQTGASSAASESSEAPQEIEAAQDGEAAQESAEAQDSAETQDGEAAQETAEAAGKAAAENDIPDVETSISEVNKFGNIVLTALPDSLIELGYEPADIILVEIGGFKTEMPVGTNYTDVDAGEPVCAFRYFADGTCAIVLVVNAGNMAEFMGIAQKHTIEAEPGYEWIYADGVDESAAVHISMVQKQGYAEKYEMHQLGRVLSNVRANYADLSDEEYANFRAVNTTGMGKDTLFRSASPIDPQLNRREEADEALLNAMVRTIMNMMDSEAEMKSYADFGLTNYSECNIIALGTVMDFFSDDFKQDLAEGLRYLASHKGPYLIHCKEGKDRTGYAAAILECLMGADADEVIEDYMLSYYYLYGIMPDSEQYKKISAGSIETYLAKTFGVSSIRDEGVDLQDCAEKYLMDIGLGDEDITALKENLSVDYGGIK